MSERLPDESIEPPTTSDNNLTPSVSYVGVKPRVKFHSQCFKEDINLDLINIYIVYEINW